jgi:hypothetical protein
MSRSTRYSPELRERAVKMAIEKRSPSSHLTWTHLDYAPFHQIQHHRKHHTPQLLGTTKPTGTDDDSLRIKGCNHRTDTSKQVAKFS